MRVVVIGRPRNEAVATAIAEYEKRAGRYWNFDVRELREEKGSDAATVRKKEGERLAGALGDSPFIACDERGRSFDSEAFAGWLRDTRDTGRDLTFVIGGAFGLDDRLKASAAMRLSLANWTLPHELARLILAEQLYRAGTILRREPYHK